jgi:hypothetical protein
MNNSLDIKWLLKTFRNGFAPFRFFTPFPHLVQSLLSRSLRSLPSLLGLCPSTKGAPPLEPPNSVPPNAFDLLGGCGTPHVNVKALSFAYVNPNFTLYDSSCSIHPRRPKKSDPLESWLRKAKSSMVASTIPKSLIYPGRKNAKRR